MTNKTEFIIRAPYCIDDHCNAENLSRSLSVGCEIIDYSTGKLIGIITEGMIDKFCRDIVDHCDTEYDIRINSASCLIMGDPGFTLFNYATATHNPNEKDEEYIRQAKYIIDFIKSDEYLFHLN